jgi:nuclear pore complex protein Nup188
MRLLYLSCRSSRKLTIQRSWESAYQAVIALDSISSSSSLDAFFNDQSVLSILSAPLTPFASPSVQSKTEYETRTAAINTVPAEAGQYDVSQIKEDALWLSKEAQIQETEALRIVLVEWQQRSASRMLADWSQDERLGIQNAAANAHFRQSVNPILELDQKSTFDTQEQRRPRLLNTLYAEKSSILAISALLLGLALPRDLQPHALRTRNSLRNAAAVIWKAQQPSSQSTKPPSFFLQCVDTLRSNLESLVNPDKWPSMVSADEQFAHSYIKAIFTQLVLILRLAYVHIFSLNQVPDADCVVHWFSLMDESAFLSALPEFPETSDLVIVVRCLTSLISLEVLKIDATIESILPSPTAITYPQLPSKSYLDDDSCIRLVTATLLGAAQAQEGIRHAGPAILAWSIIAQTLRDVVTASRAASGGAAAQSQLDDEPSTENKTKIEICLDTIQDVNPGDEDVIALMAKSAVVVLQAFEMTASLSECLLLAFGANSDLHVAVCGKMSLFNLLAAGYPLFQYGPDLVQAVLAVLSYDTVPPCLSHTRARNPVQPVKAFLADTNGMGGRFFEQVKQRYAYELRPFLNCLLSMSQSRASADGLDSEILAILESMPTLTQVLPRSFEKSYENYREDELQNHIQLLDDIPLFVPRNGRTHHMRLTSGKDAGQAKNDLAIPAGTVGILANQHSPFVVCWQHEHSALEYFGKLLSTRLSNASIVELASGPVEREAAAEIIALVDSLVHAAVKAGDIQAARHILGRLSNGLERNDDIVRVIFQMFEEELHAQVEQPGSEGSLYLLIHSVRLMQSLLSIYPERIWSLLTRSRLLSVDDSVGGLAAIVGATELPLGQYDLLRACIGLFEGLIQDVTTRAVSRNTTTKAVTRFDDPADASGSTPEKLTSAVLASFQRILLDVLQSSPSWRFVFPAERCEISTRVLNAATEVLKYAYSIDDSAKVSAKLTGVFARASEDLVNVYLAENPHSLTFHPILNIFTSGLASVSSGPLENEVPSRLQTCAALSFCSTVLNVGLLTDRTAGYLTKNLLQAMPLLARLFAAQHVYKTPIANLFASIVHTLNNSDTKSEPAPLLGHLSPEAAKDFLSVLSELDQPLLDIDVEVAIWEMFSAVVSNKQQWLSICLLTGTTPRDRLKAADKVGATGSKALLKSALDQLANIKTISPRRAMAILKFVSLAQDRWAWATHGIGKHADFLKSAADWLAEVAPNNKQSDMEGTIRFANENQMAAYAANILARYLQNARQLGDTTTAKAVATKLQYLCDHGVAVDAYNHSLHQNLARNFTAQFPQCKLENFKRTALRPAEFGRDYYYDRKIAGQMLQFDSAWSGRNSKGFVEEVARANVNMSLVESQVNLLKSWKALAIMLGTFLGDVPSLHKDLATVVKNSLAANMEPSIPAALFDNIAQTRADLAFVLLQKLTSIKSKEPLVRDLLSTAWDIVRTSNQDFEVASNQRDVEYYRTLLRILFLALQPQVFNPIQISKRSAPPVPVIPLEILHTVHKNFRALCSNVHANTESVEPADFVLLTALLQTVLRIPGIASAHSAIATTCADSGTLRYATSLYSWSDRLVSPDSVDPMYGELAILFLLELSSVTFIAEQMAVEGVLSQISSANLSHYLRNMNGKGPFDEPARVFAIWSKGILPMCLNLLEAVGPPIAAEIGAFLNSFPAQLRRAETDLENRQPSLRHAYAGCLTLGLASETHSLSLISLILERLRAVGASSGASTVDVPSLEFDRVSAKEQVEGILRSKRNLRERILPVGERESEWVKQKSSGTRKDMENKLEERVVDELEAALVCLIG